MKVVSKLRMLGFAVLLLGVPAGTFGCKKKPAPAAPQAAMVVRDETPGLLLTWVDTKGDFHVETSTKDVPLEGRDVVRIIDSAAPALGPGDPVTVADLRNRVADGSYASRLVPRAEFEALATERRKLAGIAMVAAPPTAASRAAARAGGEGLAGTDPAAASDRPSARPKVIIYGASWCGACHEAARYLASHNIPYVEKDIEASPDAAREMQTKLRSAGQRGGSIPVLDVRGTVLIGFSAADVERALGKST